MLLLLRYTVSPLFPEQQRPWLLRQMEIDTAFLQRLNVLDYSLLLAHQPLHRDERAMGLSFASVIMRTTKYVQFRQPPIREAAPPLSPLGTNHMQRYCSLMVTFNGVLASG